MDTPQGLREGFNENHRMLRGSASRQHRLHQHPLSFSREEYNFVGGSHAKFVHHTLMLLDTSFKSIPRLSHESHFLYSHLFTQGWCHRQCRSLSSSLNRNVGVFNTTHQTPHIHKSVNFRYAESCPHVSATFADTCGGESRVKLNSLTANYFTPRAQISS